MNWHLKIFLETVVFLSECCMMSISVNNNDDVWEFKMRVHELSLAQKKWISNAIRSGVWSDEDIATHIGCSVGHIANIRIGRRHQNVLYKQRVSDDNVLFVRRLIGRGWTYQEISEFTGISLHAICGIGSGRNYKEVV